MDVAHRCYDDEQSLYSQPENRRLRLMLCSETELEINAGEPMPTLKYDRLISAVRPKETEIPPPPPPIRYDPSQEQSIFFRKPIANLQGPVQVKSLLSQSSIHRPNGTIRVYFFGGDKSRQYDRADIHLLIRVGKFITHAVEDYCSFFLGLVPERVNHASFQLKLADFHNRHDHLVEPLDASDEILPYFGENLCLIRKEDQRSIHLKSFKQAIKDNCEVIEVFVPSHNNTTLKIKIQPERRFDYLLDKVFKMCDIVDSPNDYALIEYSTFKMNAPSALIRDIKDRHFELLRSKPKSYDDMCEHPQHPPMRADACNSLVETALELNMRMDIRNASHIRSSVSVEVDRAVWQEKMRLSIEDGELIERYDRGLISKLAELVCQQEYEKRYPLITLVSAFAEEDCLVLRFLNRKSNIVRRYSISEPHRGIFLNEILRLCRVNKKALTLPERFSR